MLIKKEVECELIRATKWGSDINQQNSENKVNTKWPETHKSWYKQPKYKSFCTHSHCVDSMVTKKTERHAKYAVLIHQRHKALFLYCFLELYAQMHFTLHCSKWFDLTTRNQSYSAWTVETSPRSVTILLHKLHFSFPTSTGIQKMAEISVYAHRWQTQETTTPISTHYKPVWWQW